MKERLNEIFNSPNYRPVNFEELVKELNVDENNQKELKKYLQELLDDYEIFLSRKNRYILPKNANIFKGTISIKNPDYGFITSSNFINDLYVSKTGFNGAFDKDYVVFKVQSPYNGDDDLKQEAVIIDILKRNLKTVVGELKSKKDSYYLDVDNYQINHIKIIDNKNCQLGDIVKAEIVDYQKNPIEAKVVEKIGFKNDIGIDVLEIAAKFNFSPKFSDEVIKELEQISQDISVEKKQRRKPTLENIFTIDGDDAKDLDDAVAIKKLENGNYLLGVYIADVSYYVRENSALDQEAYERGTSVYLVNRVIPMLPPLLSNNLCSLNPDVEKLVVACEMEIDSSGQIVDSNIFPSYLKTKYRMTYHNVNLILESNQELITAYQSIYQDILYMKELQEILNTMRQDRGALDFDVPEGKVLVDDNGRAIDVILIDRGESERIIEEFMLIANETVASTIFHLELPFIYRVHDEPTQLKLDSFKEISKRLGYKAFKKKVNSKQLQDFLENIKEEDNYLKTLLLRSMAKAIYSEKNIGHYGLGSACYTHFTAPIRRYPDIVVHRLLHKYIFNHEIDATEFLELTAKIADIASQSSKKERDAIECEYQVGDMKKAEYMENHLGENYEGIVSSVNRFGLFVSLSNTVEGLVHVSKLKGRYLYDPKSMSLLGVNGNSYRLGDRVAVEVIKSDKKKREIDFKIVYNSNEEGSGFKGYSRKEKATKPMFRSRKVRKNGESKRRRKK